MLSSELNVMMGQSRTSVGKTRLERLEDLPALPTADELKDTLDNDQLRLFEELQTTSAFIDESEAIEE